MTSGRPAPAGRPAPPAGVRAILLDGSAVMVKVAYAGYVDGIHQWTVEDHPPLAFVRAWAFDELPGRTALMVPLFEVEGG